MLHCPSFPQNKNCIAEGQYLVSTKNALHVYSFRVVISFPLWSWNIFPLDICLNPLFLNYWCTFSLVFFLFLAFLGLLYSHNTLSCFNHLEYKLFKNLLGVDALSLFFPTVFQGKYCYDHFVLEKIGSWTELSQPHWSVTSETEPRWPWFLFGVLATKPEGNAFFYFLILCR